MKNIIIEGHRGYCSKYPENTLISFEAAMDLGVDAFEFDVWLTSDKVPVIMHDGNAKRTRRPLLFGGLSVILLREPEIDNRL